MDQISQQNKYINHKIHFHDQMRKLIENLDGKRGDNNETLLLNFIIHGMNY